MDPLRLPRLVRQARHDSFPLLPCSPHPIANPPLHPPCAPVPHRAASLRPGFHGNFFEEPRKAFINPPDNDIYLSSPRRSNSIGFDSLSLSFPSVSDRAYHAPPYGSTFLPENWKRNRGGGGVVGNLGGFSEIPGQSQPHESLFKLGDPYPDRRTRRRLESEQGRLLWEGTDLRNQGQIRFLDDRGSRYYDPFFEQLPPEVSSLATEPTPLSSTIGLRSACFVNSRCGDDSFVFVDRPPRSPVPCGRSFSDLYVTNNTAAVPMNSQVLGNGLDSHLEQSICKKNNSERDAPDHGFRAKWYNAVKESDSINVAKEDGFWSNHPTVRKPPSIPTKDYEPELEDDWSLRNKGKMKISNDRNAKYYARPGKRHIPNTNAFSRIKSGLSVWDRLQEKPLISTSPSSPQCTLSSPRRIPDETGPEVDTHDFSIKANALAPVVVGPLSVEPSSVKVHLHVEKPIEKPNKIQKKRKKKKMSQIRGERESHIIVVSAGSSEQNIGKNSIANSSGGPSVQAEVNKVEASSFIHDSKFITCSNKKKVKKLPVVKRLRAKEAAKIVNQAEGCTIEIPMMEDGVGTPKVEVGDQCAEIITKNINQACDCVVVTLTDKSAEPSELVKTFDNRCTSSFANMVENNAANSSKHGKLEGTGSFNSYVLNFERDMPPVNVESLELLGAVEVFESTGPRNLSYIDDSLNCNSVEIVNHQEKMELFTAMTDSEVAGKYLSSQSYLQGPQDPSLSEISNAAANQKLPSEITAKDNEFSLSSFNMLPQSGCNMTSQESSDTPKINADITRLDQALLVDPMKVDSPPSQFGDTSLSQQRFVTNTSSSDDDKKYRRNCETSVSPMVPSSSESLLESYKMIKNHRIISEKTKVLPFHVLNEQVFTDAKSIGEEFSYRKSLHRYEVPRFLTNPQKNSGQLKVASRKCQPGRHTTWLRTKTLLHSEENQKQGRSLSNVSPKTSDNIHNSSYIRKGNSLIRKVGVESPPVLLPAVVAASRTFKTVTERSNVGESISEIPDNATPSYPLFERPKTPPLPPPSKLIDCTMNSCTNFPQLRHVDMSPELRINDGNQHVGVSKGLPSGNFGNQDNLSCKKVETINPKSVTYIKHKKNQLIAAPDPEIGNSSMFLAKRFKVYAYHPTKRSKAVPCSSSYLYYRSKRNQLIRSAYSSDSQVTGIPTCDAHSVDSIQRRNILPLKRLDVHKKTKQPTVSSLVWTLSGDKLSQKSIATLDSQSIFPNLLPWKRAVNSKSFIMNDRIPISSRFSLSLISQKLQSLRKRDTIYKVSTDGFSLRKAGVVSVGGSNLKWSKSIEKRSKRASEEATLAVAEVERNKRERKSKSTCRNGKKKPGLTCRPAYGTELKQGERIFRVGSARYKMDSSKRTLIRITGHQLGNNCLKSFVPRRLIIGNDEYVRIGNGNQLVRDPKKLQRILASEKIRWSLHTARLKLAQKRQYCLFFTRFGKCNKSGGKCPYIHDSSKVAICTKFLKSQCSDANCKLTHKVIPERMPDCSYFLKGLCTNINCPYRHVKVNINAPLCDGFLRGHCVDGDECHKKHSYTCPLFEATGKCPQGSLCKLRHPKSQSKSRKRRRTNLKSSSQGRYFCSSVEKAGEPLKVASSQIDLEDLNDVFCSDGRFTEYINLDTDSDNTGVENNILMDSEKLDSGYFDMKSCDIVALIKPVQIMNNDDLTIF